MKFLYLFLSVFFILVFTSSAHSGFEYPVIEDPATEPAGTNPPVNEFMNDTVPSNIAPSPKTSFQPILSTKPRVMVMSAEYVDGVRQPAGLSRAEIEKEFIANDFPLVDKAEMEMIKEDDAVISISNADMAAALGRNYGAEIVVVVEAKSNIAGTSQPYGVTVYTYECKAIAKAINAGSAQIITSQSTSATEHSHGRIPAAGKACEKAVNEITERIINEIDEDIKGNLYEEITIEVVCSNADHEKTKNFINAIDGQRSIKAVYESGIEGDTAIIDVVLLGDSDSLANLIEGMKGVPPVRITAKSARRIDLEFLK